MASIRITYNDAQGLGKLTSEFVRDIILVRDRGKRVREALEAIATGGDWLAVEAVFGLAAGQGETFYNIVMGAHTSLAAIGDLSRIDRGN